MTLKSIQRQIQRFIGVRENVVFGRGLLVGFGTRIWSPRELVIGRKVFVGKYCSIEVDGSIGDGTMIANNVGIIGRHDHDINEIGKIISEATWVGDAAERLSRTTKIGADVWIGYGATILSGVCIGDSSIIAAGSVVVENVPENTIVAGNPAKVVRNRFSGSDFQTHWIELERKGFVKSAHHV